MESKKTILITGVSGFIGFHTALKFLELGYKVVGIDNLNDYYDVKIKQERNKILKKNRKFIFIKLDFSNKKILEQKLKKYRFDKIIHLGAQAGVRYSISNPYAYLEANYLGTLNILEFARNHKISQVVLASTSSVYGKNDKQPFEEDDKTDNPISTYAASKKACEVLAYTYSHLFKLNITVLRFFTVYGPWGRPDMALYKFAKNIYLGEKIEVYNKGDMKRSFTYIDDIVQGIVGATNNIQKYKIYNLGGGQSVQLMDFIKLIEKNLKKKAKIKLLPMQAGDVKETVASTKAAGKDLKYLPQTDIEEGVERFIKWFLDNKTWLLKLKTAKQ